MPFLSGRSYFSSKPQNRDRAGRPCRRFRSCFSGLMTGFRSDLSTTLPQDAVRTRRAVLPLSRPFKACRSQSVYFSAYGTSPDPIRIGSKTCGGSVLAYSSSARFVLGGYHICSSGAGADPSLSDHIRQHALLLAAAQRSCPEHGACAASSIDCRYTSHSPCS